MSTIFVAGANGQLGWELQKQLGPDTKWIGADLPSLDIGNANAVREQIIKAQPQVVINAAAYTAVDRAETDSENALRANRDGAGYLASAAKWVGAAFLHVSTDFVFHGNQSQPYEPGDQPEPLSVYGKSKWLGEQAVLAANPEATIVRTSWVYSTHAGNFVKTMLKLMAEKPALSVVSDQIGSPTWAHGLAAVLWSLGLGTEAQRGGAVGTRWSGQILHYADAGIASWYDFAVAIQEEALTLELLDRAIPIHPIRSEQYPTPARRPRFSVMNRESGWAINGVAPHWRVQLRSMLRELKGLQ